MGIVLMERLPFARSKGSLSHVTCIYNIYIYIFITIYRIFNVIHNRWSRISSINNIEFKVDAQFMIESAPH